MNLRLTDPSGITAAIDYANDHPEVRYLVARAASAHGIEIPDTWTDPVLAAFKGKWTDKAREGTTTQGVTAAVRKIGYKWNASLHPRGRNGRFIKKGSLVDLFDMKSGSARPVLRAEAVGVERDKSGQEMLTLEVSKPGSYQGKDYKAGDTIKVSPKNVELAAESKGKLRSGDVEGTPSGTNRQSAPENPEAAPTRKAPVKKPGRPVKVNDYSSGKARKATNPAVLSRYTDAVLESGFGQNDQDLYNVAKANYKWTIEEVIANPNTSPEDLDRIAALQVATNIGGTRPGVRALSQDSFAAKLLAAPNLSDATRADLESRIADARSSEVVGKFDFNDDRPLTRLTAEEIDSKALAALDDFNNPDLDPYYQRTLQGQLERYAGWEGSSDETLERLADPALTPIPSVNQNASKLLDSRRGDSTKEAPATKKSLSPWEVAENESWYFAGHSTIEDVIEAIENEPDAFITPAQPGEDELSGEITDALKVADTLDLTPEQKKRFSETLMMLADRALESLSHADASMYGDTDEDIAEFESAFESDRGAIADAYNKAEAWGKGAGSEAAPDAAAKGDRLPIPDTENTWDASITKNGEPVTDPDELQRAAKALGLTGLDDTDPEAPMVALNGEQLLKLQQGDMLSESSGEYDLEVDRGEVEPDTIQRMQDAEGTAYKGVKPGAYEEGFEDPTEWGDAPSADSSTPAKPSRDGVDRTRRPGETPEQYADRVLKEGGFVRPTYKVPAGMEADLEAAREKYGEIEVPRGGWKGVRTATKNDKIFTAATSDFPNIRMDAAENPNLPPEVARLLAADEEPRVRKTLLDNNPIPEVLAALIDQTDNPSALKWAAEYNPAFQYSPNLAARLKARYEELGGTEQLFFEKSGEPSDWTAKLRKKQVTALKRHGVEGDLPDSGVPNRQEAPEVAPEAPRAPAPDDLPVPDTENTWDAAILGKDGQPITDPAELQKAAKALGIESLDPTNPEAPMVGLNDEQLLRLQQDSSLFESVGGYTLEVDPSEVDADAIQDMLDAKGGKYAGVKKGAYEEGFEDLAEWDEASDAAPTALSSDDLTKSNEFSVLQDYVDSPDSYGLSQEQADAVDSAMFDILDAVRGIEQGALTQQEAAQAINEAKSQIPEPEFDYDGNYADESGASLEDIKETIDRFAAKAISQTELDAEGRDFRKKEEENQDYLRRENARLTAEQIKQQTGQPTPGATIDIDVLTEINDLRNELANILDDGGWDEDVTQSIRDAMDEYTRSLGSQHDAPDVTDLYGKTVADEIDSFVDAAYDNASESDQAVLDRLTELATEIRQSRDDKPVARKPDEIDTELDEIDTELNGKKTTPPTPPEPGNERDLDEARVIAEGEIAQFNDKANPAATRVIHARSLANTAKALAAEGRTEAEITDIVGGTEADWTKKADALERMAGKGGAATSGTRPFPMRGPTGRPVVGKKANGLLDQAREVLRGQGVEVDSMSDLEIAQAVPEGGLKTKLGTVYRPGTIVPISDADRDRIIARLGVLDGVDTNAARTERSRLRRQLRESGLGADGNPITPDDREAEKEDLRGRVGASSSAAPDAPLEQFYSVKGELEVVNNQIKALGDSDPSALDELIARRALIQEKMRVAARGANIASGAIRTLPDGSTLQRRPAENDGIIRVHDPAKSVRADPTDEQLGRVDVGGFVEDLQRDNGSAASALIIEPDGTARFTPERQAIHDRIIASFLDGVLKPDRAPGEKPTMYVLGGGPASGKSTGMTAAGVPEGEKRTTVHVDPDAIKYALLAEGVNWNTETPEGVGYVHEESSYLAKRLNQAALERGLDVTLDGTGDGNPNSQRKKILQAKATRNREVPDGYRVIGSYMTVPVEGEDGAIARDQRRSRTVGEYRVRITHSKVSAVFPGIEDSFDEVTVWDTNVPRNESPILVYQRKPGSEGIVLEPDLYQQFLDKANAPMPSNLIIPPGEPGYIAPGQPGYPAVTP